MFATFKKAIPRLPVVAWRASGINLTLKDLACCKQSCRFIELTAVTGLLPIDAIVLIDGVLIHCRRSVYYYLILGSLSLLSPDLTHLT